MEQQPEEATCFDELSNGLQYVPLPAPVRVLRCDLCLQLPPNGKELTHIDKNHMDLCSKCFTNPEREAKLQSLFRDVLTIMKRKNIDIASQDKLFQPTEAMIETCVYLMYVYDPFYRFGKSDEGKELLPFPIEDMEQLEQVCMAFVLTVMMLIHNNEIVIEETIRV